MPSPRPIGPSETCSPHVSTTIGPDDGFPGGLGRPGSPLEERPVVPPAPDCPVGGEPETVGEPSGPVDWLGGADVGPPTLPGDDDGATEGIGDWPGFVPGLGDFAGAGLHAP